LFEFGRELQPPQRIAPHAFQHLTYRPERAAACSIEAVPLFRPGLEKPGVHERLKLQGNCAERDVPIER
jgi:hypothetical protein